jgi:hypothetical protein
MTHHVVYIFPKRGALRAARSLMHSRPYHLDGLMVKDITSLKYKTWAYHANIKSNTGKNGNKSFSFLIDTSQISIFRNTTRNTNRNND